MREGSVEIVLIKNDLTVKEKVFPVFPFLLYDCNSIRKTKFFAGPEIKFCRLDWVNNK